MTNGRPSPPSDLLDAMDGVFVPSPELAAWAEATFISEDATLSNEDHAHLREAFIGFLWTNVANTRAMNRVVGQAEFQPPNVIGKWSRARAEMQLREWFGDLPDFLITLDAGYAAQCGDAEFMALVEHELLHCGQARDPFGMPRFSKYGRPIYAMRGHDISEFNSIALRYGAVTREMQEFHAALSHKPKIAAASIAEACGTCQLLRAA